MHHRSVAVILLMMLLRDIYLYMILQTYTLTPIIHTTYTFKREGDLCSQDHHPHEPHDTRQSIHILYIHAISSETFGAYITLKRYTLLTWIYVLHLNKLYNSDFANLCKVQMCLCVLCYVLLCVIITTIFLAVVTHRYKHSVSLSILHIIQHTI